MSEKENSFLYLELEGLPPTVNMMYGGLRGHKYKTKKTLDFQNYTVARLRKIWKEPPYPGRVKFIITYYTPSHRRWDIDNRVKALQDCLTLARVISKRPHA